MKKLIALGVLTVLAAMVFAASASAAIRPRPPIIVAPPTINPAPVQSSD